MTKSKTKNYKKPNNKSSGIYGIDLTKSKIPVKVDSEITTKVKTIIVKND